jgi:molybdopterin-guanine dinucleotide biosynthesis protein A
MTRSLLVGLFVGGRATRMGGTPKGLLAAPDTGEELAARLVRIARETIPGADIVLVGEATNYAALELPTIADDPIGQGPLGGLHALLAEGVSRERDVIALACDLPYVTGDLLARLATHAPGAHAVAPRTTDLWQPLFARYDAARCRPIATSLLDGGRRALHGVLDALRTDAVALPLREEDARLLDDWDAPEDVRR